MMQLKSSGRGIQQEDVWKAADELLLEGQRPTIERIRLRIGRGSPNTISPMLENWFAILGKRINGTSFNQKNTITAPEPVEQAIRHVWALALEQATIIAKNSVKNQQEENERAKQILDDEKKAFGHSKQLHEAALKEQKKLLATMAAQLQDTKNILAQRNREYESLNNEAGRLKIQIADLLVENKAQQEAAEQVLENANQQHIKEREGLETRFRSLELRSVSEIDRARQETKLVQQKLEQSLKTQKQNEQALKNQLEEAHEKYRQLSQLNETVRLKMQAVQDEYHVLVTQFEQYKSQNEQRFELLKKENETLTNALAQRQQNLELQKEMAQLLEKINALALTEKDHEKDKSDKSSLNK